MVGNDVEWFNHVDWVQLPDGGSDYTQNIVCACQVRWEYIPIYTDPFQFETNVGSDQLIAFAIPLYSLSVDLRFFVCMAQGYERIAYTASIFAKMISTCSHSTQTEVLL